MEEHDEKKEPALDPSDSHQPADLFENLSEQSPVAIKQSAQKLSSPPISVNQAKPVQYLDEKNEKELTRREEEESMARREWAQKVDAVQVENVVSDDVVVDGEE